MIVLPSPSLSPFVLVHLVFVGLIPLISFNGRTHTQKLYMRRFSAIVIEGATQKFPNFF